MTSAIGRMVAVASCLGATGCISIQAIEPVVTPPTQFRFDTTTQIEFVGTVAIGIRCAERGAKFLGLPALNAGACADGQLITMLDPCLTITAGSYARDLCDARDTARTPPKEPAGDRQFGAMQVGYRQFATPVGPAPETAKTNRRQVVAFISQEELSARCGAISHDASVPLLSCMSGHVLLVSNPCEPAFEGWYERTLCHELAHVNGWRADHAGGEPRHTIRLASESPEALAFAGR